MSTRRAIGAGATLAVLLGGTGLLAARPLVLASQSTRMAMDKLKRCEAKGATLTLMDERTMTRTAVTPETIGSYAKPVVLKAGDPRLGKLDAILHGLDLQPPALPMFELRMVATIECADGGTIVIHGSPTGSDGRLDLSVDGRNYSTHRPLRKELDALAG